MSNEPPPARKEESRPVDELVVAKFLKRGIASDPVTSMMGNLEEKEENSTFNPTNSTLADQYKKTQNLTKSAFQDSPKTISLSFTLRTLLPVYYSPDNKSNCRCDFYSPKPEGTPQYQYIALHCPDQEDPEKTNYVIWILRFDHTPEKQSHAWDVTSINVDPTTGVPIDMSFYNNESIAVLRELDAEGGKVLHFELYEYSTLDYIPFNPNEVPTSVCKSLQELLPHDNCEPTKQRTIHVHQGPYGMMVGRRGVGCVLMAKRRIQLFDLEEDEEEEGEGEEEEGGEKGGEGEGGETESKSEQGNSSEEDDVER